MFSYEYHIFLKVLQFLIVLYLIFTIDLDCFKSFDASCFVSMKDRLGGMIRWIVDFIDNQLIPFVDNLTTIEAFKQAEGRQIAKAFEVVTSIAAISNGIGKSQDLDFNDSQNFRSN